MRARRLGPDPSAPGSPCAPCPLPLSAGLLAPPLAPGAGIPPPVPGRPGSEWTPAPRLVGTSSRSHRPGPLLSVRLGPQPPERTPAPSARRRPRRAVGRAVPGSGCSQGHGLSWASSARCGGGARVRVAGRAWAAVAASQGWSAGLAVGAQPGLGAVGLSGRSCRWMRAWDLSSAARVSPGGASGRARGSPQGPQQRQSRWVSSEAPHSRRERGYAR